MIEFKDGRYFVAAWYLSDEKGKNWLAVAYRDLGDNRFVIQYRFRYYTETGKAEDSKAKWFKYQADESETKVESALDLVSASLVEKGFIGSIGFADKVVLKTDQEGEMLEKMSSASWWNSRPATPEELQEFKASGPN